jgi:hypothetical protein
MVHHLWRPDGGVLNLCRRVAECMSCVAHALLQLPSAGQQIPSHALYRIGRMMCLASDRRSLASPCIMLVPGPAHVAARGQTAPEDQLRLPVCQRLGALWRHGLVVLP